MKPAVRRIERALRRLNNIEPEFRAEDFLLSPEAPPVSGYPADFKGALFIRTPAPTPSPEQEQQLSIGIYLSEPVLDQLSSFLQWRYPAWSHEQISAFTVAAEEISHFHYLLYHATGGRQVSQLELELQGEVDKFLLTYFASALSIPKPLKPVREAADADSFERLFEQLFHHFHLMEKLNEQEKIRYQEANHYAQRFVLKLRHALSRPAKMERALRLIRRFYRLNASEKISLAGNRSDL